MTIGTAVTHFTTIPMITGTGALATSGTRPLKIKQRNKISTTEFQRTNYHNTSTSSQIFIILYHFYFISLYTHQFSLLITVNFTKCDLIFRITTLWFSDSVSPLSKLMTQYALNNVCILTQFKIFCFILALLYT